MSYTLRIVLIVGIIIYYFIVVRLLKKGRLTLKYSLLWLLMGVVMAILVIFPHLLKIVCDALGIVYGMNGLFTCAIVFLLMLSMALTAIVSKQTDRINNLVQESALLEKRIREIEEKYSNNGEKNE